MYNGELEEKEKQFFATSVEGHWDYDGGDIPIPVPPDPSISTNISFIIDGENFEELSTSHYLEITSGLSLPVDFFGVDTYLINIQINDDVKQVRFSRNTTYEEKYGTTIYEYENHIYEYSIYIINDGPIVKISSTSLGIREES